YLLHGIASVQHERLQVLIASIRIDKKILPVSLSVYDLDGIEGIYIPGSAPREILRSAADQSIQSVNVLSLDPSIKTQAAMAGIGAAKNLLSRKVKNLQVTVEAGYQVLLRDTKE
ncbi:MAG: conjugative transposon protein TraM, partial [Sediminibacterium sp.]